MSLRCLALTFLVALLPATASTPALADAALAERADHWLRDGFDRPDVALAAIDRELAAQASPAAQRAWQRTRALVAARAGRVDTLAAAQDALARLAKEGDPLAAADADLARAALEEQQGQTQLAATSAQSAAEAYARYCGPQVVPRADCDYRSAWLAAQMLTRNARVTGDRTRVLTHNNAALEIAGRAGDRALQARGLALQASLQSEAGDSDAARRSLGLAQAQLAGLEATDPAQRAEIQARVAMARSRLLSAREDRSGALRELHAARRLAQQAWSPRLEAQVLTNLSDLYARGGQPREALAMVAAALPAVRRHGDKRLERLLLHNAALAHIGSGRVADAKRETERLFELWAAGGQSAEQATALREVADALAAAGDPRGALDVFHREHQLAAQLMEAQRKAAESAMRERYDREAQQRSIELKARDNAVQAVLLHNRTLTQRLWAAAALLATLLAGLLVLLLRRMRETQRALQRSQAQLRQQSERDPLTGLANRHLGQEVLRAGSGASVPAYRGALLLVDVDHFKHVNDGHGHAVGDQVLIEVARRLTHAVRAEDLVVRWGGEEFLVIAPSVGDAALDELAARLLREISGTPIDGGLAAVPVTVSIGYGAFPIGGFEGGALTWERALNLVDMALYTAKSQGRNRAVGIAGLRAATDATTFKRVEADFERAWQEGLVKLAIQPGA